MQQNEIETIARKIQSDQTTEEWNDLRGGDDEQRGYIEWASRIIKALESSEVKETVARIVYEDNNNTPPTWERAAKIVQTTYRMAVETAIEHLLEKEQSR